MRFVYLARVSMMAVCPFMLGSSHSNFYLDSYIFSMTYKIVSLFILYLIPSRFCDSFLAYGVRNI